MQAGSTLLCVVTIAAALSFWGCGDAASSIMHGSDAGAIDASVIDASVSDAALSHQPPAYVPPEVTPPGEDDDTPFYLSQTGLYTDIAEHELAPDLLAFEPRYALWSDGAEKQRWLRLPAGTQIDTRDADHWSFPVGAMLFKEFSLAGKRIETRLIMRIGEGPRDYFMGAFLWNEDESDARFVRDGMENVRGTAHDVPRVKNCFTCHDGEPGRVLGFSAVQQREVAAELLTRPPARAFVVPGDAVAQNALGYLHANCGHCHNLNGTSWPDTDLDLRLILSDVRVEDTAAFRSSVGVELNAFQDGEVELRIAPGDTEHSGLHFRMSMRGPMKQMPPLATELVDDEGLALVRAWIDSL